MRWSAIVLPIAVAVSGAGVAVAQDSAIAADLRKVDGSWRDAYLACDAEAWDALLADDLSFLHNNGSIDDKATQMASVQSCNMASLESQVSSVRVYGDDTAVVLGALQGQTKGGFEFDLLYTRVYVLQDGAWRLAAHQSTDVNSSEHRD